MTEQFRRLNTTTQMGETAAEFFDEFITGIQVIGWVSTAMQPAETLFVGKLIELLVPFFMSALIDSPEAAAEYGARADRVQAANTERARNLPGRKTYDTPHDAARAVLESNRVERRKALDNTTETEDA